MGFQISLAPQASPLSRSYAGETYVIYGGELFNGDMSLSGQLSIESEINVIRLAKKSGMSSRLLITKVTIRDLTKAGRIECRII